MNNFKIGETVIALTNPHSERCQDRIKGKEYTVTNIFYCQTTGEQMININNNTRNHNVIIRCVCGQRHNTYSNLQFTLSKLFVRPQNISEQIKKAVEIEDYDTAILLRDLNISTLTS